MKRKSRTTNEIKNKNNKPKENHKSVGLRLKNGLSEYKAMADTDGSLNPHYDTVKTPWSRATNFVSNPFVILALIVAVTFIAAIVQRRKKFFHQIIKNHVGRARSRKREYKWYVRQHLTGTVTKPLWYSGNNMFFRCVLASL